MSEVRLDFLEVTTRGDEQRRARVTEVVEPDPKIGRLCRGFEEAVPEVVMMDGAAVGRCEHEAVA